MAIKTNSIKIQDLEIFELPYTKEQLRGMFLSYDIIGHYQQDTLTGILIFRTIVDEATLVYIKVLEEYQQQGIATELIQAYHQLLGPRFTYFLDVNPKNLPALSLYQKLGYRRNRIRKNYYPQGDGWEMIRHE